MKNDKKKKKIILPATSAYCGAVVRNECRDYFSKNITLPFKALSGHVISQILNVTCSPMHRTIYQISIFPIIFVISTFFFFEGDNFFYASLFILTRKLY
jgi:hypothetical protein